MEWQTYTDSWYGIQLEHPAGWMVHPEPGGARVMTDEAGWSWAYGRWLAGEQLPSPERIANGLLARLRTRFPTLRAFRSPSDPERPGLLLRLEAEAPHGPLLGLLRVVPQESILLVLGYLALRGDLPTLRPDFERVLCSFRPLQPLPRNLWREPTEGAFTVQVPLDWGAQGGVQRDPSTGFGQMFFQATADPQGLTTLWMSTTPQMFVSGGGFFGMGLPGVPAHPYSDVPTFVQQILFPQMAQTYPDAQIENVRPLPRVEARLAQEAAQVAPGQPIRLSAAEVVLRYSEDGIHLRHKQEMHTYEGPAAPMMPQLWFAETPWGYRAPLEQFDTWEPVLSGMAASFAIEPAWQSREMGMRQQQVMAAQRRTQSLQMMTYWNISRDQDLIDSMIMSSYERRSAVQDRVAQGWSDAMLGQRDITTSWGDTLYGVEAGFNRYWVNAVGDVLASDNWLFEPGVGWEEVH